MPMLDSIEFLTTTVEAGSFAAAARRLGVTPSAVSRRVAALEQELGVPLLARNTRSLRLTHDGEAFHERCVRILQELHEARDVLARTGKKPSGLLRVDAPIALGRAILAPAIPRFLDRCPDVRLDLTLRDQFVDPIAEGLDVLVRIGRLGESNLMSRKLGESRILHCAAPAYLRKHGVPKHPRELTHHACLGYLRDGQPAYFEFLEEEGTYRSMDLNGPFHANDSDVLFQLAVAGKGIVALFDFLVRDALEKGTLVTVLDAYPSVSWPIHTLYPRNRHLLPKASAFLDFLAELFQSPGFRQKAARAQRPAGR
ncbi:LysR family transcriptional regulator [Vitiosangium sp. GDMCC 1.1324]|uniref:LysR family transcriptional regulator n=1 Tax=Vitiosangium sp. (strain GDMCC 1.1324) TaxID=2138576 RepID=UPI000D3B9F63|nr:LysR family transcriptional regulator [Vitiosangium sp. GDMCC 1.1324]PTL84506.1 LysR family transcriptional regulator [Vitiosangium sp. GDMCC 1.1324]